MKRTEQHKINRIKYLEKKYSETNVAKGECLTKETIYNINKNYQDKLKKRQIDSLLNEIRNPLTVKDEVYGICDEVDNLKQLCRTCSIEQIITVVILYVQRLHNPRLIEEDTHIWRKYKLTWKRYALITSRILTITRKRRGFV